MMKGGRGGAYFLGRLPGLNGVVFMGIPGSVLHSFNCALFVFNYRQNTARLFRRVPTGRERHF
jgi:hypothetical protein